MFDREKLGRFDLGRLTLAGWLVALLSVAGGLAIGISLGFALKSEFAEPNGKSPNWTVRVGGGVGFGSIIVLFLASKWLLDRLGFAVIRPEKSVSTEEPALYQSSEKMAGREQTLILAEKTDLPEAPGLLNRPVQVIIGLILVSLGGVLALLAQLPDLPRNPLVIQGTAGLAGIMGLASIFTWGRPYTLRFAFGLSSIMLFCLMVSCVLDAKPDFKAAVFAGLFGLLSGAYAIIGKVPDWGNFTGSMGLQNPECRLKLTNTTDQLKLVVTEPSSQEYWLNPGETVELRAYVQSADTKFDVQDSDQGVVVFPSQGMGGIKVYSGDNLLPNGYQRPEG